MTKKNNEHYNWNVSEAGRRAFKKYALSDKSRNTRFNHVVKKIEEFIRVGRCKKIVGYSLYPFKLSYREQQIKKGIDVKGKVCDRIIPESLILNTCVNYKKITPIDAAWMVVGANNMNLQMLSQTDNRKKVDKMHQADYDLVRDRFVRNKSKRGLRILKECANVWNIEHKLNIH